MPTNFLNGLKQITENLLYQNGIFIRFLINKEGKIEDTFSSFTKPLSNKIINKIEKILKT